MTSLRRTNHFRRLLPTFVTLATLGLVLGLLPINPAKAMSTTTSPGVVMNCRQLPPNFDPIHASDNEIRYYGLPSRPQGNAGARTIWASNILHIRLRSCSPGVSTNWYSQSPFANPNTTRTATNPIWSGFVAKGTPLNVFNQISAVWNVPCQQGIRSPRYRAVSWIGIGGYSGTNLWQAGTTEDSNMGYHFFYEAFPGTAIVINNFALNCGDTVGVYISYGVDVPGAAYFNLEDISDPTGRKNASGHYNFQPDMHSAEAITERPSCELYHYYGLADFDNVGWASVSVESNGAAISHYPNDQLRMVDSSSGRIQMTAPTALYNNGYSFKDYWRAYGSDYLC